MNRLSTEKSAYLKHSANQKIDWYPWSEEAFEIAKQKDKPLFLSSGAVWCHWCHVMAKECFYDDEIANFLNEHFISIKLDRDERPDIDRRYQMAIAAMGAGGGWPLTVFLAPDKIPFYGGTYFPPEDKMGRPGLKKVLVAVNELYKTKKDEISEYMEKLMNALKSGTMPSGTINESMLDDALRKVLSEYDPQNGGFGTAPKFPMPGAIDFLLSRYYLTRDDSIRHVIVHTLESMASGGFYDQLGGGFHRYSTDAAWIIPHFEKMADDNAWLLRNYLTAYHVLGDDFYREVSEGIIGFILGVLSDPEGGFYASQDADVTPDDEGGYFTWTEEDFRRVLSEDEHEMLARSLFHDAGSMHHDTSKKVLFIVTGAKEIAHKTGKELAEVMKTIRNGKVKLLRERNERETPFIDRTLYTSINGMLISVFFHGYRILKDSRLKDFALKSLEKILEMNFIDEELFHTEEVKALLDDYIYIIDALVSAYEATGESSYLSRADEIMEMCIRKLWDNDKGGFFDTDDHLLGLRIKGIEDIPHPSANSLCIILLLKLSFMTKKESYRKYVEKAVNAFSGKAHEIGIHAGYYWSALYAYFHMLKLTVHAAPACELSEAAIFRFNTLASIVYGEERGCVIPCIQDICYEPIHNTDGLSDFFNSRKYI